MKLQVLLTLFVVLAFSGCCGLVCDPVYVDRPIEVKVPVPCVVPEVLCGPLADLNDSEVVIELYRCIKAHEQAEDVCR